MYSMPKETGWIEVICGSMFSGKTEELMRRIRRAEIAKQKVRLFKPQIDTRWSESHVVSHDQRKKVAIPVYDLDELRAMALNADVIAIDEVQFFGPEIVDLCDELANQGKRVIVSGLDQDYLGKPFGPMPQLLAVAEYITKIHAICVRCGNPANRNQRITKDTEQVVVGGVETYEARCRRCFHPENQDSSKEKKPISSITRPAFPRSTL